MIIILFFVLGSLPVCVLFRRGVFTLDQGFFFFSCMLGGEKAKTKEVIAI